MHFKSNQIGHLSLESEGAVRVLSKRPSFNCLIHFYTRGVCQVSSHADSHLYSGLKRKSIILVSVVQCVVRFFTTRWCWRWNTVWRTKLVVSFICTTLVAVKHLNKPQKIDTHNLFVLFFSLQIQLMLSTRNVFKATKLDKLAGPPEKQCKSCLNDQATIA